MHCIFHENAGDFVAACEGDLLLKESENSLMLGLLGRIVAGTLKPESPIYVSVDDGGTFVGHALRTNLHTPLDLTAMPEDAVAALVDALHANELRVRTALGVTAVSACFAERWTAATGVRSKLAMRQGIYELREVMMPPADDGVMVQATTADHAEVEPLVEGFNRDIEDDTLAPANAAREMTERHLSAGTLYLWKNADGQLVSIAAKNRETRNGATISLVYTPPEHRRRGYAGRRHARRWHQLRQRSGQAEGERRAAVSVRLYSRQERSPGSYSSVARDCDSYDDSRGPFPQPGR